MGSNIRLENRGAIRAVQLAGDSCLCNQVRGVSLHSAERYQRLVAEDGGIGTEQDNAVRGGFCLRNKQRVEEEVGGTVGLVANGYGAAGNEVCRQKTWYDRKLKANSSGRRWGGSVDAVERAVGVCRLSVWVV